jgi:hypothetical protein
VHNGGAYGDGTTPRTNICELETGSPHVHGHVDFTPTYASWLNQVEICFNRITQQAIRRGTFRSVRDLVEKIDHYVQNSNRRAQPFVWTATADSIFAKVQRLCERIYGTAHWYPERVNRDLTESAVTTASLVVFLLEPLKES